MGEETRGKGCWSLVQGRVSERPGITIGEEIGQRWDELY